MIDPVVLHMEDGSTRTIRGSGRHFQQLCAAFASDTPEHPLAAELHSIRDAVVIDEGAHIFELLQALLQGPNLTPEDEGVLRPRNERWDELITRDDVSSFRADRILHCKM